MAAFANSIKGKIVYRFHARDLNLVIAPGSIGPHARFRVLIDGQLPGMARGADIDEQGFGTANRPGMIQLIRQPGSIADRDAVIEFLDAGTAVYDFTFG